MRMRVGVVGGQKRKTEAHLFKSLKEIDIDVAWHVEAMTNREFPLDADCIVSMFDYIGHGLEKRARDFADMNGIPFRRISFNWSKSKPVFLELKEKFEAGQPANGDDMRKAVPPNKDLLSADDMGKELGIQPQLIRKLGREKGIKEHWTNLAGRRLVFFSRTECLKVTNQWKDSVQIVRPETVKQETIGDSLVKFSREFGSNVMTAQDNEQSAKPEMSVSKNDTKYIQKPLIFPTVPTRTVFVMPNKLAEPDLRPDYISTNATRKMYLCRVKNEIIYPIISIDSLDDIDSAVGLDMTDGEKEYVVMMVIKRIKAEVKLTITEINEPM